MAKKQGLLKTVYSALFFALTYVLPFLTGQIPEIGAMLCPMHLPVLLCGYVCGWPRGLAVGFAVPLFRSLTLGAPSFFPTAVCMAFELGAYGAVAGIAHRRLPKRRVCVYGSLIIAMLAGRLVWGASMLVCTGIVGNAFTLAAFLSGAVINALPGIVLQLLLIPPLVMVLDHMGVLKAND